MPTQPTYEQLAIDLRANQIAVDVARGQRNAAQNELADLAARFDIATTALQTMANEKAALAEQVADLTAKLAAAESNRAQRRTKK